MIMKIDRFDDEDNDDMQSLEGLLGDIHDIENLIKDSSGLLTDLILDDVDVEEAALLEAGDYPGLIAFWNALLKESPEEKYLVLKLSEAYNLNNEPENALVGLMQLYNDVEMIDPIKDTLEHHILDSLFQQGKDENDFNWLGDKPTVLRLDAFTVGICYTYILSEIDEYDSFLYLSDLYIGLREIFSHYLLFTEKQMIQLLAGDERFELMDDPGEQDEQVVTLKNYSDLIIPSDIYQLKIMLNGSDPLIWRRLLIPASIRLSRLHEIIQLAMGWEGWHEHYFYINGETYGELVLEDDVLSIDVEDETGYKLKDFDFQEKDEFCYEYDLADGWEHDIVIEKIEAGSKGAFCPRCLDAEYATPPEDCGGIGSFYYGLKMMAEGCKDDSLCDLFPDDYDFSLVNVGEVNARLKQAFS